MDSDKFPRPASDRGRVLHPNLKVNHLIIPFTKDWHLPIFQEFMDSRDISLIRGLEISPFFMSDNIIWYFTKSGRYKVKSDYWLSTILQTNLNLVFVREPSLIALKAHVWKIPRPTKFKHFIWQILTNSLAVTSRLNHRSVNCSTICKRRGTEEETINHALFECP